MKITSAIITKMPRPMPEGMFDPMPEVVATFEDGSTKSLFSFFPDEVSFQPFEFVVSPKKKPTASSNAKTPSISGHETTDSPQRHRTPEVGDQVQIVPEWQDQGDGKYERFVIVGVNAYIKPEH